jgi:predicted phosphodiesterase
MTIAVVSDIHSNLHALAAVLRDLPLSVTQIWCLGDVVNYYAYPHECMAALHADARIDPACWLLGNHDAAVVGHAEAVQINPYGQATMAYTREQLSDAEHVFLADRTPRRDFQVNGWRLTLAHGSPADPLWHYLRTAEDAEQAMRHTDAPLCIVGHTHIAQAFTEEDGAWRRIDPATLPDGVLKLGSNRTIVNVGGVGQPRDGNPDAAYLIFDPEGHTVTFRRCAYPIAQAQQAAREKMSGIVAPRLLNDLIERLETAR